MKKIFLILLIIYFTTGCNSYMELNDLGIINKIGIEKENNKYKLTAAITKVTNKNEYPEQKIITVNGLTISDIINNLSISLSKKIYLSHLDLLIINNTINQNELTEIINYFLNNNETRNDFLVITTNDINNIITNSTWQEINNLIKINLSETNKSIYTTMYDLMNNYFQNKPIYVSNISFDRELKLNGITKIYHNKQINIPNDKTIFINYILNNIKSYKLNLKCQDNKFLYLNILSSQTNTLNNNTFITNEINIIKNDCNLNKDNINKLFNNYLKNNLHEFTNNNININNTIRGLYENY